MQQRFAWFILTKHMKGVFTDIDTNECNILHDGLSWKKNTLSAYRSQGGGDYLINRPQAGG